MELCCKLIFKKSYPAELELCCKLELWCNVLESKSCSIIPTPCNLIKEEITTFLTLLKNPQTDEMSDRTKFIVNKELERRKKIMERACSVVGDLNQMASNGTSYQDLLEVHRRIHNFGKSIK